MDSDGVKNSCEMEADILNYLDLLGLEMSTPTDKKDCFYSERRSKSNIFHYHQSITHLPSFSSQSDERKITSLS